MISRFSRKGWLATLQVSIGLPPPKPISESAFSRSISACSSCTLLRGTCCRAPLNTATYCAPAAPVTFSSSADPLKFFQSPQSCASAHAVRAHDRARQLYPPRTLRAPACLDQVVVQRFHGARIRRCANSNCLFFNSHLFSTPYFELLDIA